MAGTGAASQAAQAAKTAVVDEVRERMQSSTATVLTEYRGLTVAELARLRAELRRNDAEYKVVKNTLTRIAAREAGLEVPDSLLTGPTAITFVAGDPVAVAKVLRQFSKENPELVVKGSILEGRLIDAAETLQLADLASREELLAKMAGMMEAVVAQPARLALASLSKMARLLAAFQDRKAQEPAPAPEAEAPEAEEAPAPEAEAPEAEEASAAQDIAAGEVPTAEADQTEQA